MEIMDKSTLDAYEARYGEDVRHLLEQGGKRLADKEAAIAEFSSKGQAAFSTQADASKFFDETKKKWTEQKGNLFKNCLGAIETRYGHGSKECSEFLDYIAEDTARFLKILGKA